MPMLEEMNSLAQEIISSYEERVKGIAHIRKATHEKLQGLDASHNSMARQLREKLQELDASRIAMARRLRGDLAQMRHDLADSVASQLKELDTTHKSMAQKLRADMDRAETARRQDKAQRARERAQMVALLESSVSAQLKELHEAQARARAEWQDLVATMQSKRSGAIAVWVGIKPASTPPPAVVKEVAPAAPIIDEVARKEEEEAVARAVVGMVTSEFASLTNRVFEYLAKNPDGTRLTELEEEFKLGRFQAARVVKHLMDEGKAEKRDFFYFAV